jgi:hypothetical protein
MNIITGTFNAVTTLIGGTVKLCIFTGIGVGAFAVYTKPSDDSFYEYINSNFLGESKNSGQILFNKAASLVTSPITDKKVQDYLFFKIGSVKLDGTRYYLGACQNWIFLGNQH